MPDIVKAFGTPTRVTATGYAAITSANAAVVGILFTGTGTGSIQLFAGVTASVSITGIIRAYPTVANATVNQATYLPVPVYCSGGLVINVPATADPDVTLFWNPV